MIKTKEKTWTRDGGVVNPNTKALRPFQLLRALCRPANLKFVRHNIGVPKPFLQLGNVDQLIERTVAAVARS